MSLSSRVHLTYSLNDTKYQQIASAKLSQRTLWMAVATILLLQFFYAAWSLNNSAFQDEALYVYSGYEYVHFLFSGRPVIEQYGYYFSGLPYLYPFIAGVLNEVGGLEAARLFSAVSISLTSVCVFLISGRLFGARCGLIALALFSVQSSILFMSRLATYDAICLALSSLALTLTIFLSHKRFNYSFRVIIGIAFLLLVAILSKYAAFMFVPSIIGILGWVIFSKSFHSRSFMTAVVAGMLIVTIIVSGIVTVFLLDHTIYEGVMMTTADRQTFLSTSRSSLIYQAFTESGLIFVLAGIGLIIAPKSWKTTPIHLTLLVTMLIPTIYHVYKTEVISFQKHLGYGILFGSILAGYCVMKIEDYLLRHNIRNGWLFSICMITISFALGISQSKTFYSAWADLNNISYELRAMVRPSNGQYLAEDNEVLRYYMRDLIEPWQWNNLYWFEYTDADDKFLEGTEAYYAAIDEGYFDLIILNSLRYDAISETVFEYVKEHNGYQLIAEYPISNVYGDGAIYIWQVKTEAI